jgi:ABC-type glycerol-3-phosphate transport system substrate-binding protein
MSRDVRRTRSLGRSAIGALSALGVAATLVACGGGSGGGGETSAGATSGDASAAANLKVLQWHTSTPDAGLGKAFIQTGKDYEAKYTNQKVSFQADPFDSYVASGTTACRAKKLPSNVMLLPGLNFSALFPCVTTLTDKSVGALKTELTGWDSATVKPGQSGSYVGIPLGGQGVLFYYNKTLFAKAGLDPANPPKTWAEFAAACKALKAKGIDPIGVSGADQLTSQWLLEAFLAQMYPKAADVTKFATGGSSFDDPRTLKALQAVEDTYTAGWWAKGYADKKFDAIEEDFTKGRVAMTVGIITDIMSWNVWDSKMDKSSYGAFSAPLLPGATATTQVQDFYPAILSGVAKDAPNPAAAMQYSSYLASKVGQTTLLKESGTFPNRQDVDVTAVTASQGAGAIQAIVKDLPTVDSILNWLDSEAYAAFGSKIQKAVTDGKLQSYLADVDKLQSQAG